MRKTNYVLFFKIIDIHARHANIHRLQPRPTHGKHVRIGVSFSFWFLPSQTQFYRFFLFFSIHFGGVDRISTDVPHFNPLKRKLIDIDQSSCSALDDRPFNQAHKKRFLFFEVTSGRLFERIWSTTQGKCQNMSYEMGNKKKHSIHIIPGWKQSSNILPNCWKWNGITKRENENIRYKWR